MGQQYCAAERICTAHYIILYAITHMPQYQIFLSSARGCDVLSSWPAALMLGLTTTHRAKAEVSPCAISHQWRALSLHTTPVWNCAPSVSCYSGVYPIEKTRAEFAKSKWSWLRTSEPASMCHLSRFTKEFPKTSTLGKWSLMAQRKRNDIPERPSLLSEECELTRVSTTSW